MAQGDNRSLVHNVLSDILIEMTQPIEELLGGPRIEPMAKAIPRDASSSLSSWKNHTECTLPPVPRLRLPLPYSLGWFASPNNFAHKHKPRSLDDKQMMKSVTRSSYISRSQRDWKSRQKANVPRSQGMWKSTSHESNSYDQRIGVPPRYPNHKAKITIPLKKTRVGHQISNDPANSLHLPSTEKGRHGNASKQNTEVLSLKPLKKQEVSNVHKNGSRQHRTELQAKKKVLEMSFKVSRSRCISLYSTAEFDDYEQEAKRALQLCFDLALVMESELRLSEKMLRRMSAENQIIQKRDILKHYDYITHEFADGIIKELQGIGRKQTASFYRQGVQKVRLRKLALQTLWDRDMKIRIADVHQTITDSMEASRLKEGKATREREISIRISMDKLELLKRIILERKLLAGVVEGIVSDLGKGHEEAGHECRIQ